MSRNHETRFKKGESGNPNGRPKAHKPPPSAFDIVFDQTLMVKQNGVQRELTVDEGLQLQTYQAALKGSRMAVRAVLKMIEKREVALAKLRPKENTSVSVKMAYDAGNADQALRILNITEPPTAEEATGWAAEGKIATWAAQAAIDRLGRTTLTEKDVSNIKLCTVDPAKLRWPTPRRGGRSR